MKHNKAEPAPRDGETGEDEEGEGEEEDNEEAISREQLLHCSISPNETAGLLLSRQRGFISLKEKQHQTELSTVWLRYWQRRLYT